MAALYRAARLLARRSYVTLAGKGSARRNCCDLGALAAGRCWPSACWCSWSRGAAALRHADRRLAQQVLGFRVLEEPDPRQLPFRPVRIRRAPGARSSTACISRRAAASLVGALGALIGWIDLRTRLRRHGGFSIMSRSIPLGLPGIVMAVALIQFWLRLPVPLYGTLAILLLAYVGALRAAGRPRRQRVVAPDRSVARGKRAASSARPGDARCARSRLPLIRPGLFAGWLLVFVPAIQELCGVDPAVQLELDHPRGGDLQSL